MLRTPNTLKLYRDVLRDMETEALEQMKSFYDQFEGELEGHALTPEDLKGGARGIGSYFRKLRDGRLSDKDVLNATLQNSLTDAKNWATKTSSRKERHHPSGRNQSDASTAGSRKNASATQPYPKQLPPLAPAPQQTATSQSYRRRGTHAKPGAQPLSALGYQRPTAQTGARG